jgi:hypothetical protein
MAGFSFPALANPEPGFFTDSLDGASMGGSQTANAPVTVNGNASEFQPLDGTTADGHTVYQYELDNSTGHLTGYCLQDTSNDSEMVMGACDTGNSRQQWWYNKLADGSLYLENIFAINEASPLALTPTQALIK